MNSFMMEWFGYNRFDLGMLLMTLLHGMTGSPEAVAAIADDLVTVLFLFYLGGRCCDEALILLSALPGYDVTKQSLLNQDLFKIGVRYKSRLSPEELQDLRSQAGAGFRAWLFCGLAEHESHEVKSAMRLQWAGKPVPVGSGFVCESAVWSPTAPPINASSFSGQYRAVKKPLPAVSVPLKDSDFEMKIAAPAYHVALYEFAKPNVVEVISQWVSRGYCMRAEAATVGFTGYKLMQPRRVVNKEGKEYTYHGKVTTIAGGGGYRYQTDRYSSTEKEGVKTFQQTYATSVHVTPFGSVVRFFRPFLFVMALVCLITVASAAPSRHALLYPSTGSYIQPSVRTVYITVPASQFPDPGRGVCPIPYLIRGQCDATHPPTSWKRADWCINSNFTEPTLGELSMQALHSLKNAAAATTTSFFVCASGALRFFFEASVGFYLSVPFGARVFILALFSAVLFLSLVWFFTFCVYAWRAVTRLATVSVRLVKPQWVGNALYWLLPQLIYNWLYKEQHVVKALKVPGSQSGATMEVVPESAIRDAGYVQTAKMPSSMVAISILIGDQYIHHGWGARIKWKKGTGLLLTTHQANDMRSGAGDSFVLTNPNTKATTKILKSQIVTLAGARFGDLVVLGFHQRFWSTLGISAASIMPLKHKVKMYAFYSMNDNKAYLQTTRLTPYGNSLSGRTHYASTRASDSGTPIYTTDGSNIAAVHVAGGVRDSFGFAESNVASSVTGLCVLAGVHNARKETVDYDPEEQWDARLERAEREEHEQWTDEEDEYYDYEENLLMRVKRDLEDLEDEENGNEFRPKVRGSVWETPLKGASWADDDEDYEVYSQTFYNNNGKESLNLVSPPKGGPSTSSMGSAPTSGAMQPLSVTQVTSSSGSVPPSSPSKTESEPKLQPSTITSSSSAPDLRPETSGPTPGPTAVSMPSEHPSSSKPEISSVPASQNTPGQQILLDLMKQISSLEEKLSSLSRNLEPTAPSSAPAKEAPAPAVEKAPPKEKAKPEKPKGKNLEKPKPTEPMEVKDPKVEKEEPKAKETKGKPKYTQEERKAHALKMKQQEADAKAYREMMAKNSSSPSSGAQSSAPPPSTQKVDAAASSTGQVASDLTSKSA